MRRIQLIHSNNSARGGLKRGFGLLLTICLLFLGAWLIELPPLLTPSPVLAQGSTYYVAPSGDDSRLPAQAQNPATPWRTIQHAANTLTAGDTVYIRAGTYAERVIPANSGSAGNYITYAAYPGETVIIDGNGIPVPTDEGLFDLSHKNYLKISGLQVINSAYAGIYANGASYIVIEKNYTYNTDSSGIGVWSSNNIIIDGNEVELACHNGAQESMTVAGTDTFEIKNNHVHNEAAGYNKEGIDAKDGSANGKVYGNHVHHTQTVGIYVEAWDKHTYNIEIYQNVVHDTQSDGIDAASEQGGLLENIKIYNNVVYHNKFVGINVARNGPASVLVQPLKNIQVINNTVYNNGIGAWGGGIAVSNQDAQNVVVRNNISYQNLSFQIAAEGVNPPGLTVDHNLVDPFMDYPDEFHGSVEADPRFVNPAAADFRLQSTSPAIDQGVSTSAPAYDFDGNPRPQDGDENGSALYDLGAYEVTHLTAASGMRATNPGGIVTYTIIIGSDFTNPVSLITASPSPSLTISLAPPSLTAPGQATLTITDTHPGPTLLPGKWYTIPVTATGGQTRVTYVTLLVGGVRLYLPIMLKG